MGLGTARGGYLFCNQKISWVRFPIALLNEFTSKLEVIKFLIEKYYGDLNPRELRRKTVREIRDMMEKDAIDAYNQELVDRSIAIARHRLELVHRHG